MYCTLTSTCNAVQPIANSLRPAPLQLAPWALRPAPGMCASLATYSYRGHAVKRATPCGVRTAPCALRPARCVLSSVRSTLSHVGYAMRVATCTRRKAPRAR
jgi:hypothetical protein